MTVTGWSLSLESATTKRAFSFVPPPVLSVTASPLTDSVAGPSSSTIVAVAVASVSVALTGDVSVTESVSLGVPSCTVSSAIDSPTIATRSPGGMTTVRPGRAV